MVDFYRHIESEEIVVFNGNAFLIDCDSITFSYYDDITNDNFIKSISIQLIKNDDSYILFTNDDIDDIKLYLKTTFDIDNVKVEKNTTVVDNIKYIGDLSSLLKNNKSYYKVTIQINPHHLDNDKIELIAAGDIILNLVNIKKIETINMSINLNKSAINISDYPIIFNKILITPENRLNPILYDIIKVKDFDITRIDQICDILVKE